MLAVSWSIREKEHMCIVVFPGVCMCQPRCWTCGLKRVFVRFVRRWATGRGGEGIGGRQPRGGPTVSTGLDGGEESAAAAGVVLRGKPESCGEHPVAAAAEAGGL